MSIPLQSSIVYGPIASRRLGTSLGINIFGNDLKFCHFDCLYCQYGFTDFGSKPEDWKMPDAAQLLGEIENGFDQFRKAGVQPARITFSGNGESTLHPEFETIAAGVKKLRDEYFPGARLAILSSSGRAHLPRIRKALEVFDERYMKLDAGDAETFEALNQPLMKMDWEQMVDALAEMKGIILQSMFVAGRVNNAEEPFLSNWIHAVGCIRPEAVQIYSLDREPADPGLARVPLARLEEIARRVTSETGVAASVFA